MLTRPLTAQSLSDLIYREPDLLQALAAQLLPPPLASIDPAETVIAHGEITPAEGPQIAEGVDARLRSSRRLARLMRWPYKRDRSGPCWIPEYPNPL